MVPGYRAGFGPWLAIVWHGGMSYERAWPRNSRRKAKRWSHLYILHVRLRVVRDSWNILE